MRVVGAVLLLMLGACSAQPAPAGSSSPGAQSAYDLSCRLPVLWFNQDPRVDGNTGFVTFPAGSLTTSAAILPTPPPLTLRFSYDGAIGRWLQTVCTTPTPTTTPQALATARSPLAQLVGSTWSTLKPVTTRSSSAVRLRGGSLTSPLQAFISRD